MEQGRKRKEKKDQGRKRKDKRKQARKDKHEQKENGRKFTNKEVDKYGRKVVR